MNKIQFIELLKLRGITELRLMSIADAVQQSGCNPTEKEMVKVNEQSMNYYIEKLRQAEVANEILAKQVLENNNKIEKLEERDNWLRCLEQAGVGNWEGYDIALELRWLILGLTLQKNLQNKKSCN